MTTTHLTLDSLAAGQILDALEIRTTAWEKTERYLRTDEIPDDFATEECSDADEARQIAESYRAIIRTIHKQQTKGE